MNMAACSLITIPASSPKQRKIGTAPVFAAAVAATLMLGGCGGGDIHVNDTLFTPEEEFIQVDPVAWRPSAKAKTTTKLEDLAAAANPTKKSADELLRQRAFLTPAQVNRSRSVFEAAFELFQKGNFKNADQLFEDGLAIDPTNSLAHYYLAETKKRLDPKDPEIRIHLSYAADLAPDTKEGLIARSEAETLAKDSKKHKVTYEYWEKNGNLYYKRCQDCPEMIVLPERDFVIGLPYSSTRTQTSESREKDYSYYNHPQKIIKKFAQTAISVAPVSVKNFNALLNSVNIMDVDIRCNLEVYGEKHWSESIYYFADIPGKKIRSHTTNSGVNARFITDLESDSPVLCDHRWHQLISTINKTGKISVNLANEMQLLSLFSFDKNLAVVDAFRYFTKEKKRCQIPQISSNGFQKCTPWSQPALDFSTVKSSQGGTVLLRDPPWKSIAIYDGKAHLVEEIRAQYLVEEIRAQ